MAGYADRMRIIGLAAWVLATALPALAAAAPTTGFITTRPRCSPPKYAPDALNYLQGPEPLLLQSGDVAIIAGTGRCCTVGKHWEGIFSLTYPAVGKAMVPRFHPLWATNDFSRQPKRKEAEIGFPSALFWQGKWRLALTTTFLPFHVPNRDRVGRIDLPDLVTRATTAQVKNSWVTPIDPLCLKVGSCQGEGSGRNPMITLHPDGALYVYHQDGNYPDCNSGYVRHRLGPDLSVTSSRLDGCIEFDGLAERPPFISDIGRRPDGTLSMLAAATDSLQRIEEWESTGSGADLGLVWHRTGRTWAAPAHPNGGTWSYYVRDAAFLKDESRTIVEPELVVAQISDGANWADIRNVQLGRWFLYYWAEEDAPLPPTFGGPADACAYQGALEGGDCTTVRGWAWDPLFPTSPVSVDILVDGKKVGTAPADVLRPGLHRGDERHGFAWSVPATLRDGKQHKVTARFTETPDLVPGKTVALSCH
jgi:hypothetical protein